MGIKIKSVIVIIILIFSVLFVGWNFNLRAKNSKNEPELFISETPNPLSNGNHYWGQIKVVSEPIAGQNNNMGMSLYPQIAVENDKIYLVWIDQTIINGAGHDLDVFYRYFDGSKWSETQVISEPVVGKDENLAHSLYPAIAVENGKIYVVWYDNNTINGAGADYDISFRCNITGNCWEDIQVISEPILGEDFNIGNSYFPDITVDNGEIFVVWEDQNNTNGAGTDLDIFYRCNLTGSNWEDIQVISEPVSGSDNNIYQSEVPSIASENGKIYVVWEDYNNTNDADTDGDIFYCCNLTGVSWEEVQVISEPIFGSNINTELSALPDIAIENDNIYVVWADETHMNGAGIDEDIFYRCNITGSGWGNIDIISEPVPGTNSNSRNCFSPAIAVENNKIHVVWEGLNNTNGAGSADWDISYRGNLTGLTWENIEVISEPIPGNNVNIANSTRPDIGAGFDKAHAVWNDFNNTNGAGTDYDIFYRKGIFPSLSLSLPSVIPIFGNTSTEFIFTVLYTHVHNKEPTKITVAISGSEYSMLEVDLNDINYSNGKSYYFKTTLNISKEYTYQFWAWDGINTTYTIPISNPDVYNTPPTITTQDNVTAVEDEYYEVEYKYEDIDKENVGQLGTWNFSTNASWINLTLLTGILYGTPMNDDVGNYWVNITIYDGIDIGFHNFTITVIDVNDNPIINTSNIEITYEDELYFVDYNATDIDSSIEDQIWSLNTNASHWLGINASTGIVSGVPTNDDVGCYCVNVSVNDTEGGMDLSNYTLIVLNVNDPPVIVTEDITTAKANELYEVDYDATDIDSPMSQFTWSLDTNASWLDIESDTGILSGTPSISDLGWYNVNVSVADGDSGLDWHEFMLIVTGGYINKPPNIITEDILLAKVNVTYYMVYNATDDRTPIDLLVWSLKTNASWLSVEPTTGILNGMPTENDIGTYWVNISVSDGEGGVAYHNFTITVVKPSIPIPRPNTAPELTMAKITPTEGDTKTEFTFSVHYFDADNDSPTYIQLIIDTEPFNMILTTDNASNGIYEYKTKLSKGQHIYYYEASDGIDTVRTDNFTTTLIQESESSESQKLSFWSWLIIIIIVAIIIVLMVSIILIRSKMKRAEKLLMAEQEPEMNALPKEDINLISPSKSTSQLLQPPPLAQLEQPEQTEPEEQLMEEDEALEE